VRVTKLPLYYIKLYASFLSKATFHMCRLHLNHAAKYLKKKLVFQLVLIGQFILSINRLIMSIPSVRVLRYTGTSKQAGKKERIFEKEQ